jgi:hypothetical protein
VSEADGVITERQAEVGQVVQATMPIFSLAVDGDRDAVFNVYESLLVAPPSDAGVVVSLLDNPRSRPMARARNHPDRVRAKRHGAGQGGLRNVPPGMQLGSPVTPPPMPRAGPSIELPWSALTKALHEPAVWVVGEGDKVELRKVRWPLPHRQDRGRQRPQRRRDRGGQRRPVAAPRHAGAEGRRQQGG